LRLLEHLLPEASWRVVLTATLARLRLYPAIDVKQCLSRDEERLLPAEVLDRLLTARGALPRRDPLTCYQRLMSALEMTEDMNALLQSLASA
jgi:transcription termination factor Rho